MTRGNGQWQQGTGTSGPADHVVGPVLVGAAHPARPYRGTYLRFGKPLLDRVLATLLLLLAIPVLAVVALVVLWDLGAPVLFVQQRAGRGGKPFRMYKFRTMQPDRRRSTGGYSGPDRRRTHKSPSDPRLTRIGSWLRAWSLDELPQLLNVIRGDMSLVGPRPELLEIVDRYEPWQHRRHQVKPGITGLWQISLRGDAPMHERTDVDLTYLRKMSLRTDLAILWRTIPAALGLRRGF